MPLLHQSEKKENKTGLKDVRTRLGQINFVNCLPVLLPLTSGHVDIDADISEDTPANLNWGYSTGILDLGAMSSFYYLLNEEDLVLLPDLSISTKKEVGSVLFFAKEEIKRVQRIVVPASSATSVALLKLYLVKVHALEVDIVAAARPDLAEGGVDAALVIGDRALTVDKEWTEQFKWTRVDLGQWWSTNFQSPMVFGVWAARKSWFDNNGDAFERISRELKAARDLGLGTLFPDVLNEAEKRTALSRARLQRYFLQELDYCLSSEHLKGLSIFKEQLTRHSILI